MSKSIKAQAATPKAKEEARAIARGTQKPGQTKEQTKLIAQGIKKGIELYKKQQNTTVRELDKKRKQALKQLAQQVENAAPISPLSQAVEYKQHWLPWLLLVLSWIGMGVYFTMFGL